MHAHTKHNNNTIQIKPYHTIPYQTKHTCTNAHQPTKTKKKLQGIYNVLVLNGHGGNVKPMMYRCAEHARSSRARAARPHTPAAAAAAVAAAAGQPAAPASSASRPVQTGEACAGARGGVAN